MFVFELFSNTTIYISAWFAIDIKNTITRPTERPTQLLKVVYGQPNLIGGLTPNGIQVVNLSDHFALTCYNLQLTVSSMDPTMLSAALMTPQWYLPPSSGKTPMMLRSIPSLCKEYRGNVASGRLRFCILYVKKQGKLLINLD